jgi:hypothetical protein
VLTPANRLRARLKSEAWAEDAAVCAVHDAHDAHDGHGPARAAA